MLVCVQAPVAALLLRELVHDGKALLLHLVKVCQAMQQQVATRPDEATRAGRKPNPGAHEVAEEVCVLPDESSIVNCSVLLADLAGIKTSLVVPELLVNCKDLVLTPMLVPPPDIPVKPVAVMLRNLFLKGTPAFSPVWLTNGTLLAIEKVLGILFLTTTLFVSVSVVTVTLSLSALYPLSKLEFSSENCSTSKKCL